MCLARLGIRAALRDAAAGDAAGRGVRPARELRHAVRGALPVALLVEGRARLGAGGAILSERRQGARGRCRALWRRRRGGASRARGGRERGASGARGEAWAARAAPRPIWPRAPRGLPPTAYCTRANLWGSGRRSGTRPMAHDF
eukprot:4226728-Prymnesium_polylepis.1